MTKIKDLYKGESISVWKDEENTFLSIWNVTVSFPNGAWNEIKEELREL